MVYIVSWNVAGWPTTSAAIRQHFSSISTFLSELQVDIFCIQESKVTKKRLTEDGFTCGAEDRPGYPVAGFESFWSCCSDRSFNGVTTFVRNGLTIRADDRPFDDPALNDEGRCLVTYHSHFVVFNVYVPYAQQGLRQDFKSKFQHELRLAMVRARAATGLPVILVGDLNLSYRIQDCHYTKRRFSLDHLVKFLSEYCESEKQEGKGFSSPLDVNTLASSAEYVSKLIVQHYSNKDTSTGSPSCATTAELIKRLVEVIEKMGSDNLFAASLQSNSFFQNAHLFLVSEYFGLPAHPKDDVKFMETLLTTDGMVDTFVMATEPSDTANQCWHGRWVRGLKGSLIDPPINERYPLPFTAWDQHRNRRYDNDGNRIDYILVDGSLSSFVAKNYNMDSTDENTCATVDKNGLDQSTFFSAFCGKARKRGVCRATAGGGYAPAPSDGSGLQPLATDLIKAPMQDTPLTGLFITPPQYSDHIGVTLVLEGIELQQRPASVGVIDKNRSLFRRTSRNLLEMFAKKNSVPDEKSKRLRDSDEIIIN